MLHRKGQKENWTDLSFLGQEHTFKPRLLPSVGLVVGQGHK